MYNKCFPMTPAGQFDDKYLVSMKIDIFSISAIIRKTAK